jgi:hypothetical protein
MKVINAERDKMSMVKIFNWEIVLNIIKAKWNMLTGNNVKSNKHRMQHYSTSPGSSTGGRRQTS